MRHEHYYKAKKAPKVRKSKKVGRQQSDRECVYKRAERLAVTFFEKGGTTERVTDF